MFYDFYQIEEDRQTIIDDYFEYDNYYEDDEDEIKTICYEDLKDDKNIRKNLNKSIQIFNIDDENNYNQFNNLIDNISDIDNFDFSNEIINNNNNSDFSFEYYLSDDNDDIILDRF